MEESQDGQKNALWLPVAVRSYVVILLISVIAYKVIMTPFNLQFDFPALLSLLLAIFSVGLAALFYFKATETSNTFYDNTYKFSQDIGALLARIESGFGERLKHLDDSYTSMRDQLQKSPTQTIVAEAKHEIKEEQKELQSKLQERDRIIEEFATRAKMQDHEKIAFLQKLSEREKQLDEARQEMHLLQRHLLRAQTKDAPRELQNIPDMMQKFIRAHLLPMIGPEYAAEAGPASLRRRFAKYKDNFPSDFLDDMKKNGLLEGDNDLTEKGIYILRSIANDMQNCTANESQQPNRTRLR